MRKPIQMFCVHIPNSKERYPGIIVYALCDDGTMWSANDERKEWFRLPNIPQEKEEWHWNIWRKH